MKNIFKLFIYSFITITFINGCSGGSDDSSTTMISGNKQTIKPKIPSRYYGKWVYVHSGEEIDLLSTTDLEVTQVDNDTNLLSVTNNGHKYYLARASLANTTVNGKIEKINTASSSPSRSSASRSFGFSGIGNINIILSNVLDSRIKESTTTESDGSFTTTTLPSGTYNLKADEVESIVEVKNEVNDIGTYKLTGDDLNNFKAQLIINEEFIYANNTKYEAILRVHNISDKIGYGLSYDINMTSNSQTSFTEGSLDALGSVGVGSYKDIPISFSFNNLSSNMKTFSINVVINDALGNTWRDSFKFNVHKDSMAIIIKAKSSKVSGYIKNPLTGKIIKIDTSDGKIIVPLMPASEKYILALTNQSFTNETVYSIGVNKEVEDWSGFKNTAVFEPNNNQVEATTLASDTSEVAYLHATDLDFYTITTPENMIVSNTAKNYNPSIVTEVPQSPINLIATDGVSSADINVSWNASSTATYYKLYESGNFDTGYSIVSDSNQTSYSTIKDINTSAGVLFYYKVKACNAIGCSSFSSTNSGYIKLDNVLPLADAGADQIIYVDDNLSLLGSATDSDGTISSVKWFYNGSIISETISYSTNLLAIGSHDFALVITDNDGAEVSDYMSVEVKTYPTITSGDFNAYENQTVVGQIIGGDADGDSFTYSLGSDSNSTDFDINATGYLTFRSAPDYEDKNAYYVNVIIKDEDNNTYTKNIGINIVNIDDAPVFTVASTLFVDENEKVVGVISATNDDNNQMSYSIVSGADSSLFSVDSNGTLSFNIVTDFEAPLDDGTNNTYAVDIKVINGTAFAEKSFLITVNDIGDFSGSSKHLLKSSTEYIKRIVAIDMDNDNDIDIVTMSDSNVTWLENNGTQSFTRHPIASISNTGYSDLVVHDFDGDGHADVVVASVSADSNEKGLILYKNNGIESFIREDIYSKYGVKFVKLADVAGDGDLDLIFTIIKNNTDIDVNVQYNEDGNITKNSSRNMIYGTGLILSLSVGSYYTNNDGTDDGKTDGLIVKAGEIPRIFDVNQNADFTEMGSLLSYIVSNDMDNDGYNDFVSVDINKYKLFYAINERQYPYNRASIIANSLIDTTTVNGGFNAPQIADINGDGYNDIIDIGMLYINDKQQGFTGKQIAQTPSSNIYNIAVDMDSDGDLDIVSSAESNSSSDIVWYENFGDQN